MQISKHLTRVLGEALGIPATERNLTIKSLSRPSRLDMGDIALPCFRFSAGLKASPAAIAARLASAVAPDSLIHHVQAQGPYLNLFLRRPEAIRLVLQEVFNEKENYGRQDIGQKGVIVLDYSHPNIAKPFHFGHLRSTNLGADMARIFEFSGYDVWRQNYLGDWGTQFGFVIYAWQRYGDEACLQERAVDYLVELYIRASQESEENPGVREAARNVFRRLENGDPEIIALWQRFRNLSVAAFTKTYERLRIAFDSYEGEAAMNDKVGSVIDRFLRAGVARESEGAIVVDVADVIGREIAPCMLRKSDGASTYAARDCAAAIDRWEKHEFVANIYVCSRQEDHFAQVLTALKKLAAAEQWEVNWPQRCENISFGYVKGMSTRKGQVVWLDDVLDEAREQVRNLRQHKEQLYLEGLPFLSPDDIEQVSEAVGQAAILYFDVSSSRMADITFDWNAVLQFEGNTGPYLQYTYARMSGIFRKAAASGLALDDICFINAEDLGLLTSNEEWSLVLKVREFRMAVRKAAEMREPHEIAKFLFDLASVFNHFYHVHKVLNPDNQRTTLARLGLVKCIQTVLGIGLKLLGIQALDVM